MKKYLVGGAVRDILLGREPKDRDYVVVGATKEEFIAAYPDAREIGNTFPVFLLPDGSEIALARLERKTDVGHNGFAVEFGPEVTLEEDLSRRDLTMNAMAIDDESQMVDLFGGARDLKDGVLRHVGPAFVEDPLRVFRLARFAAQLGFSVAADTIIIARSVSESEIAALPSERICEEFRKAMRSPFPRRFVEVLETIGTLSQTFPELAKLRSVPAGPSRHHQEGDALTHTLMVVDEAVKLGANEIEVTAALFHDLGKGTTPPEEWPKHLKHEERGVTLIDTVSERLKLPILHRDAARVGAREHLRAHCFTEMRHVNQVDLITTADKSALRAEGLALVAESDARGRGVVLKERKRVVPYTRET